MKLPAGASTHRTSPSPSAALPPPELHAADPLREGRASYRNIAPSTPPVAICNRRERRCREQTAAVSSEEARRSQFVDERLGDRDHGVKQQETEGFSSSLLSTLHPIFPLPTRRPTPAVALAAAVDRTGDETIRHRRRLRKAEVRYKIPRAKAPSGIPFSAPNFSPVKLPPPTPPSEIVDAAAIMPERQRRSVAEMAPAAPMNQLYTGQKSPVQSRRRKRSFRNAATYSFFETPPGVSPAVSRWTPTASTPAPMSQQHLTRVHRERREPLLSPGRTRRQLCERQAGTATMRDAWGHGELREMP
nr:hypothetical protein Iba_chr05cCG9330 [Ipomoea batatas]